MANERMRIGISHPGMHILNASGIYSQRALAESGIGPWSESGRGRASKQGKYLEPPTTELHVLVST